MAAKRIEFDFDELFEEETEIKEETVEVEVFKKPPERASNKSTRNLGKRKFRSKSKGGKKSIIGNNGDYTEKPLRIMGTFASTVSAPIPS